jgi:hypothetical protein
MLRPRTSPCQRLHLHTTEPRCEYSWKPSQRWESTWHAYRATLSFESHPTERGSGTTRVLGFKRLELGSSLASGHVIEVNGQSQHAPGGRVYDMKAFRPALFYCSTMALYAVKANGKRTSSLSHPSIFVLSQEDCRHAEKYKMASCLEHSTICSKQEQLGICNHVGRQLNPE